MANYSEVALVTGGGVGMGAATSRRLARDGFAVAVLDINKAAAEDVAAEITTAGGRALAVAADIAQREQVAAAIEQVRAQLGPVSVLVNNAGVEHFARFQDLTDDDWDRQIDTNLKGAYIVTQVVLPDMLAQAYGRIINISSFGAQVGAPGMVHYTASKGGIIAMTRSLAMELGRCGITVNTIAPGFIDTPMARRTIAGNKLGIDVDAMVGSYPIPRMGRPEEVAAATAFFASEEASYITAQLLGVNGGTTV
ncbi:SDR family NAD(P)-dependent oxidoreductase [Halioxenophilus sp. WMMB6]|uniref:SDR family NAD(P)-dependent oxidoreductase n=1 Tax=Halioxenophilus sp. WMMB6 TaxID=3073815 RepID=UPI00295E82CF|nr:SDR family NAD(P)-dependent oxidoreductase [Halioxenophilus sp. WMMB6]